MIRPLLGLLALFALPAGLAARAASVQPYDHIFVIMEENHEYGQIIGNKNAPNLNAYATTYGLATDYDAVTHPSAPNYVALTGGSFFKIMDDNPWQTHKLKASNLTRQLDAAGKPWKGYFQTMPNPGFTGDCYPTKQCYYASKHNGPIYFDSVNGSNSELAKEVPITQLASDLAGTPPAYAVIVPDICHDMHGGAGTCLKSTDAQLVAAGDAYAAGVVSQITGATFWARGHNAVVIVWDEGNTNLGGGGHVPAIVITSDGPRGLVDGGAYSHYSLLATIEAALGVGCLRNSCSAGMMAPLFSY